MTNTGRLLFTNPKKSLFERAHKLVCGVSSVCSSLTDNEKDRLNALKFDDVVSMQREKTHLIYAKTAHKAIMPDLLA